MSDHLLKKVYSMVDKLLESLRDNGSGSLYELGDELYDTEGQMAKNLLVDHGLISFQKGYVTVDSSIDITTLGLNVFAAWLSNMVRGETLVISYIFTVSAVVPRTPTVPPLIRVVP